MSELSWHLGWDILIVIDSLGGGRGGGGGEGEAEIVGAKWSRRLRLMRARQNMRDSGEGGENLERGGGGRYEPRRRNRIERGV